MSTRKSPDLSFLSESDGPSFGGRAYDDGIAPNGETYADRVLPKGRGPDRKPRRRRQPVRARRVRSNLGENFASAKAASLYLGMAEGAVSESIREDRKCAGRKWHYRDSQGPMRYRHAKPSERAA